MLAGMHRNIQTWVLSDFQGERETIGIWTRVLSIVLSSKPQPSDNSVAWLKLKQVTK